MESTSSKPTATSLVKQKMTTSMVLLMSIAIGLTVASNYYAQPLLYSMGEQFSLSAAAAGSIVTVAQLSYAAGLVLFVPLGDVLERRNMIVAMSVMAAIGLMVTASASSIAVVLFGTALAGCMSVAAQILIPFASTLATKHERGRVVGTLMAGLLLGILLARVAAGIVADLYNWRAIYWLAAIMMLAASLMLRLVLPKSKSATDLSHKDLLVSLFHLYIDESILRSRALIGVFLFASFGVFWTPLAFLLAGPPHGYSNTAIGLFGLAGAAGAMAARPFGHLADRGLGNRATILGLMLLLLSWLPIMLGQQHVIALIIGAVLLDMGIQGVHVANMSAVYRLAPEKRSRLTAAMMAGNFAGAASGSFIGAWIFPIAAWTGVSIAGALFAAAALAYAVVGTYSPSPCQLDSN